MRFCIKCGTNLPDGTAFCPKCGQAVNDTQETTVQNTTEKQTSADAETECKKMYDYFSKKTAQFDEYIECENQLNILKRGVGRARKVWGIILIVMSAVMLLTAASVGVGISKGNVTSDGSNEVALGLLIVMTIAALIFGIILLVKRSKMVKANLEQRNLLSRRISELDSELKEYYVNYGYCELDFEYTIPSVIKAIYDCIRNGRAKTIQEAVYIIFN